MAGDLTANLSRSEFRCKCGQCAQEGVDIHLPPLIQDARDVVQEHFKERVKIHIESGNRCASHNKKVGGSPSSKHLYGLAADFWFYVGTHKNDKRLDMKPVYDFLLQKYKGKYGFAFYKNSRGLTRIHADVATIRRPWRKNYAL